VVVVGGSDYARKQFVGGELEKLETAAVCVYARVTNEYAKLIAATTGRCPLCPSFTPPLKLMAFRVIHSGMAAMGVNVSLVTMGETC
jgi:hypothetical protein